MAEGERAMEECNLWLGREDGNVVQLVDGCHSEPEGVVRAAKLLQRIFKDAGPWVMVRVEPLPELEVTINEQAAEDCRQLVEGTFAPSQEPSSEGDTP